MLKATSALYTLGAFILSIPVIIPIITNMNIAGMDMNTYCNYNYDSKTSTNTMLDAKKMSTIIR